MWTILVASSGAARAEAPWRLGPAIGSPAWLRLELEHRARGEWLEEDFRGAASGDSAGVFLRTLLLAEITPGPLIAGVELIDSRAYTTEQTPLNNTLADPLDLLQGYLGVRATDLILAGDRAALTVGRFTLDAGGRRLVARNEYRNTINSFTGVDLRWTDPGRRELRTFLVWPVIRRPADREGLAGNDLALDQENTRALFLGAIFTAPELWRGFALELYLFGLFESDGEDTPSSDRRLVTPGLRVVRAPAPGRLDAQLELMVQLGTSRASAAPGDTTDLTHRAASLHAQVGYRLDAPGTPRFSAALDVASGDGDPGDDRNGRFDPLFGARRFDFGPTGIYGPFARSNLVSPGVRFELWPHAAIDGFAALRLVWLASSSDLWTTANRRDPSGDAGSFLGQQLEARIRWHLLPKNLTVEAGAAHLFPGRFARQAPPAAKGAPTLVYGQLTLAL